MPKLVEFEDKVDIIDSPEVPDTQKLKAQEFNDLRDAVNEKVQTSTSSGVKSNLEGIVFSATRVTKTPIRVQLQDSEGVPYYVETTADQIMVKNKKDVEITLKDYLDGLPRITENEDGSSVKIVWDEDIC